MSDPRGFTLALFAYVWWGLSPIYWRALDVPSLDKVAHRVVWTVVFLAVVFTARRGWADLRAAGSVRHNLVVATVDGILISINWGVFVWAVEHERVVEASLGYFMNPLVSVLLGVFVLGERLRAAQWTAVSIAAVGVGWLAIEAGRVPWIALSLAFSFGFYGLNRKRAAFGSLDGLALETGALFLPALAILAIRAGTGHGTVGVAVPTTTALLVLSGVVTALPLLAFAVAARRVALSTVGILLYVNPTLQFLVGAVLYDESVPARRLAGYVVVWGALAMFVVDQLRWFRAAPTLAAAPGPVGAPPTR